MPVALEPTPMPVLPLEDMEQSLPMLYGQSLGALLRRLSDLEALNFRLFNQENRLIANIQMATPTICQQLHEQEINDLLQAKPRPENGQAASNGEAHILTCHGGLTSLVIPLGINDLFQGHLVCGGFRVEGRSEDDMIRLWLKKTALTEAA